MVRMGEEFTIRGPAVYTAEQSTPVFSAGSARSREASGIAIDQRAIRVDAFPKLGFAVREKHNPYADNPKQKDDSRDRTSSYVENHAEYGRCLDESYADMLQATTGAKPAKASKQGASKQGASKQPASK